MFDMYVYRRGQRIWKGGGKIEKILKIGLKIAAFHLTPPSAEGGGGTAAPPLSAPVCILYIFKYIKLICIWYVHIHVFEIRLHITDQLILCINWHFL